MVFRVLAFCGVLLGFVSAHAAEPSHDTEKLTVTKPTLQRPTMLSNSGNSTTPTRLMTLQVWDGKHRDFIDAGLSIETTHPGKIKAFSAFPSRKAIAVLYASGKLYVYSKSPAPVSSTVYSLVASNVAAIADGADGEVLAVVDGKDLVRVSEEGKMNRFGTSQLSTPIQSIQEIERGKFLIVSKNEMALIGTNGGMFQKFDAPHFRRVMSAAAADFEQIHSVAANKNHAWISATYDLFNMEAVVLFDLAKGRVEASLAVPHPLTVQRMFEIEANSKRAIYKEGMNLVTASPDFKTFDRNVDFFAKIAAKEPSLSQTLFNWHRDIDGEPQKSLRGPNAVARSTPKISAHQAEYGIPRRPPVDPSVVAAAAKQQASREEKLVFAELQDRLPDVMTLEDLHTWANPGKTGSAWVASTEHLNLFRKGLAGLDEWDLERWLKLSPEGKIYQRLDSPLREFAKDQVVTAISKGLRNIANGKPRCGSYLTSAP